MILSFNFLWDIISNNLIPSLETDNGVYILAKNRSKFEGWLKVELCNILYNSLSLCFNVEPIPEKDHIDIVIDDWAIELKTVNTSYRHKGVVTKTRPITYNIKSVLDDINSLHENANCAHKAVLFVVFPINDDNDKNWDKQIEKIRKNSCSIKRADFYFKKQIPARLYFAMIGC